ncbi:mucoidy inhibitor MuiA family protein [Sphingobacterium paucimobilis]|uniref:DUF4139 domain-containing protein n=1 Tax=Sphingobacterium paucimobilis HER1398 TaxID=1346330 RepID=U2HZU1_9SPHI|nr:mucoidy inhibitor MuiA family protein [Sphingobacterium paucimobilis]ERJ60790.1 hypothetical protein M472_18720 [Sphingobacterium paucimobilis HER1398]
MRKLIFCISLLGLILPSKAQQKLSAIAEVKEVTVYANGAQVQNRVLVNLPAGSSDLIINNVASDLDEGNVQISGPDQVSVLSIAKTRAEDVPISNVKYQRLKDSLDLLIADREVVGNKLDAAKGALQILKNDNLLGGGNGKIDVADLSKLVDYYQMKSVNLNRDISSLNKEMGVLDKKIAQMQMDLRTYIGNGGQLKLQLVSNRGGNVTLDIRYMTYAASWQAYYDLKAVSVSAPLKMLYKASVSQNTGVNWQNAKLILSTGNPTMGGTAPVLSTSYAVIRNLDEELFSNLSVQNRAQNKIQSLSAKSIRAEVSMDSKALEEVAIATTSMVENQLSTTFDIEVPYTILSNGQPHSVTLKEFSQPAIYKYYAVPKLDKDAFLMAEITDFQKLNLIPGEANISFENMFVGKSYINPNITTDTLNLSLGRDHGISIKRERIMDQKSTQISGSWKRQIFTYEIKVRNNKSSEVDILLKDQYPISTDKSIEVELLEAKSAQVNAETGIATWTVRLKPNETQTYRISYMVKSPKDKSLAFN